MLKKIVKALVPPIIQSKIKSTFLKGRGYFSGPYQTWEQALKRTKGYNSDLILEKIKSATVQAMNDKTLFVRDGVTFTHPQYAHTLNAALLKIVTEKEEKLNVLDFGGGLGTSYFSFKKFMPTLSLNWYIIEQAHFVECAKEHIQCDELLFFNSLRELTLVPNIIVLSAVLQYLEHPYAVLDQLIGMGAEFLFLDRTWFNNDTKDKIVIENVPKEIYKASYPCWLLSYPKLKNYLSEFYEIIFEFNAIEGEFSSNGIDISSKGLFLKRRV